MSNVPSLVAWSDDFSLKMPEIDAQHRVPIDLINQVWGATVASKPDAVKTIRIVEELEKYTLTHFTAEEIFMREMNYPDFKRHKQAHDQFVARISEEKQKIIAGQRLNLEIVHFLKDWLINHILVSDKEYAAQYMQRGHLRPGWVSSSSVCGDEDGLVFTGGRAEPRATVTERIFMSNRLDESLRPKKINRSHKKLSILVVGEAQCAAALIGLLQDRVGTNVRLLTCKSLDDAREQLSSHLSVALVLLLWDGGTPTQLSELVQTLYSQRNNSALSILVRSQTRLPLEIRDALWHLGVVDRSFSQPWMSAEMIDAVAVAVRNCRRHNALANLPALSEAFCSVRNLRDLAVLSLQAVHEQGLPILGGLFCYLGSATERRPLVIAGTGCHADHNCIALRSIEDPLAKRMMQTALEQRCSQFGIDGAAIYLLTANAYAACLFFSLDGALRPWEKSLLDAFSNMIATAIDQSQMAQQLRRSRNATITTLSALAEFRDVDTGEHVARVARMTTEIAHLLAQDKDEIDIEFLEQVGMASILHDTGKIAIPDSILLKPGPLSPEERRTMEQHVVFGYEHLAKASRLTDDGTLLSMAADVARHHHERFDGTGYPDRLRGEEIPLSARIVALVDVYDALISKRPYKQAWPHEKAMELIRAESGQHFDPAVVNAFVQLKAREKTTRYIVWSPTMSVGHPDLDADHQQLIDIVNRLWMANGMGNRQIIEFVIDDLVHYTEFHFAREERLLKQVDFSDIERHFKIHRNICRRLEDFRWEYFQGIRHDVRIGLLDFVTVWLNKHILEEDMQYSSHFFQRD